MSILAIQTGCTSETSPKSITEITGNASFSFYTGTYTRDEGWVKGKAEGIYLVTMQDSVVTIDLAATAVNPSYLAISEDGKNLYAVSELGRADEKGVVLSFDIMSNGKLSQTGIYQTGGRSPAHVSIHPSGSWVYVTNYSGGVLQTYLRHVDGTLRLDQTFTHSGSGPHPNQNASHLHMALPSADGRFVYIPDLGADRVWIYRSHSSGRLQPNPDSLILPPGSGPRHMTLHPKKSIAYILNELKSTLSVAEADPESGALRITETTTTLPESYEGWNSAAAIRLHPDGKRLFASNRGHNSIAVFSIDDTSAAIIPIGHIPSGGDMPRDFNFSPDGAYLFVANQNSDTVVRYRLSDSLLTINEPDTISVPTPVSIVFSPQ